MKHYRTIIVIVVALSLILSCGSSKSDETMAVKERQLNDLKELVDTKSFIFKAETASPMQTYAVMQVTSALLRNTGNAAGRIYLAGNGDYIKIMGDTVKAELSYFGEARMVTSLDPRDNGINFEGQPTTYKVSENEKKNTLSLEFDIKSKSDQYSVIMQLYPSKHAKIFVNSANRTSIRYDGEIEPLLVEKLQ